MLSEEEAGGTDNRMSLSIGDHPEVKDWQDGSEYIISNARIRQKAPGEFEVVGPIEAQPAEDNAALPPEGGEMPVGNEETPPPEMPPGPYSNPALNRLVARR